MAKKKKRQDPLADLLNAASPEVLAHLIVRLASSRPDVPNGPVKQGTGNGTSRCSSPRQPTISPLVATWRSKRSVRRVNGERSRPGYFPVCAVPLRGNR